AYSLLDMPIQVTKSAPKTFKRKYSEVKPFIEHYERLLILCHISTEADKVKCIKEYVFSEVERFIEASEYYT
ncbi:hypothetical protein BDQ12DRAFT_577965, partial [Crucibulum laeve]